MKIHQLLKTAAMLALGIHLNAEASEVSCGPLKIPNKHGPYDYRTATPAELNLVERAHFTPAVEALIKPMFRDFGPDLGYTLWAFPNHHRALVALINLTEKEKSSQPVGLPYPAECYFERAIRYKADDNIVRMLYANFLVLQKRKGDAITELNYVENKVQDNPLSHYNLAQLYMDAGNFNKARIHAKLSLELGWPKTDIKERLESLGQWADPLSATSAATAGGSAAPAAPVVSPTPASR